jgi:hypothetical protein
MNPISSLIHLLASSYPSYRPNPDIFNIYSGKLKDYPIEDIEEACNQIVETNKYFPTLQELIALIKNIGSSRRDNIRSRAKYLNSQYPFHKNVLAFDSLTGALMRTKNYDSVDDITENELAAIVKESGVPA